MATLLMRTSELAVEEKLSMANVEHARLQVEKARGHGEHEVQNKTLAEGRSRARKGKNAQKKQPQRGLGVAQLEKLRLQEQSKQEAACLASLQSLPTFGFADQNGGICFRDMKGTISANSSAFSFCNGRFGPPEKVSGYLASGEGRRLGKGAVDGDVFRTIMSLATSDHSSSGALSRHAQGPAVSMMLPRHKEECEPYFVCNTLQTGPRMTSLTETARSKGQGSCGNSSGTDESHDKLASCALASLSSPPKSTAKSSLFSNPLSTRVNLVDSSASNGEEEEKRVGEVDRGKESALVFPVAGGVLEAGVLNAKLLPLVGKDGPGRLLALTNLQCFESSLGPASVCRLPRDRTDIPVVGVALSCDRPKELSSFQSFSSNHTWSATEKTCGQKRPWYAALKEGTSKLLQSETLDLNVPAGEVEVVQKECCSAGLAQSQEGPVGAHYTTGIIRSALGNTLPLLKIKACAVWQEDEALTSNVVRDLGFYSDESFTQGHRTPQSKLKDSCSSVCPPSALTLNRRRCLSSPEVPMLMGSDHQKSGDFLTLGLSSHSYPTSPQIKIEVDSEEVTAFKEIHRVKRVALSFPEMDDNLELQMCSPDQHQPSVALGGHCACTDNNFFSSVGKQVLTGCQYSSLSSNSLMEYCDKQTRRTDEEESLDLRLKL